MSENFLADFRYACTEYLTTVDINNLRAYARSIGVTYPTKMKKTPLVEEIVDILSGKKVPLRKGNRGAPVKSDYFRPDIGRKIEEFRLEYLKKETDGKLAFGIRLQGQREKRIELRLESPEAEPKSSILAPDIVHRGQLETINGVWYVLDLRGEDTDSRLLVPDELIGKHDLREGDIVSCHAEKSHNVMIAKDILTINNRFPEDLHRVRFEDCEVCDPSVPLRFSVEGNERSNTIKFVEWVFPVCEGQRVGVVASPKTGKSQLLYSLAEAVTKDTTNANGIRLIVLLIDQTPEIIGRYRKILDRESLLYSTYEDEAERQVFLADFALKRAKRQAESGDNVVMIVDSLSALARAYNETEESSGGKMLQGGLESKTLTYIKRFFASGRRLEGSGSLTIFGSIAKSTGNPADELICSDLSSVANMELRLREDLALKRIYPALDTSASYTSLFLDDEKQEELSMVLSRVRDCDGSTLMQCLASSKTRAEFLGKLCK